MGGLAAGVWYRLREYYYDSRREGFQRTDEEHYAGLERLCGDIQPEKVICDPSAASFIAAVRAHGRFKIAKADNDVISGIRRVADMLSCGTIKISPACADCIREFALYRWDDSAAADRPVKRKRPRYGRCALLRRRGEPQRRPVLRALTSKININYMKRKTREVKI